MKINLNPEPELLKKYNILAHLSAKDKQTIFDLPAGRFSKEVAAIEYQVARMQNEKPIFDALESAQGNMVDAAKLLKLTPGMLRGQIKKLGFKADAQVIIDKYKAERKKQAAMNRAKNRKKKQYGKNNKPKRRSATR